MAQIGRAKKAGICKCNGLSGAEGEKSCVEKYNSLLTAPFSVVEWGDVYSGIHSEKESKKLQTFKPVESFRTERGTRQRILLNVGADFDLPEA